MSDGGLVLVVVGLGLAIAIGLALGAWALAPLRGPKNPKRDRTVLERCALLVGYGVFLWGIGSAIGTLAE